MLAVCQHRGCAHLHRHLAVDDLPYNRRTAPKVTETERATDAIRGEAGKRLTYRRIGDAAMA